MDSSISWELSVQSSSGTHPETISSINSKVISSGASVTPVTFVLPDILSIVAPILEYATSPYQTSAERVGREWLLQFKPAPEALIDKFLEKGNFGRLASMSFPTADEEHFITAYKYYLWAFFVDDAWDEGGIDDSYTADDVQEEVNACWKMLDAEDLATAQPSHPFAAMLLSILVEMAKTATPGCRRRFAQTFKEWSIEAVEQCRRRSQASLPSVEEYIDIRRRTVGQGPVAAIIEYAVQADLPDEVFAHPTFAAMSNLSTDILTWPNDLISFNKEQAEGDYQNFVCVLMRERGLGLQGAVDALTSMIAGRVEEYARLRASLPSFGVSADHHLARYLGDIEHETYGFIRWCYESKRYWRKDVELHQDIVVQLFPSKA